MKFSQIIINCIRAFLLWFQFNAMLYQSCVALSGFLFLKAQTWFYKLCYNLTYRKYFTFIQHIYAKYICSQDLFLECVFENRKTVFEFQGSKLLLLYWNGSLVATLLSTATDAKWTEMFVKQKINERGGLIELLSTLPLFLFL